MEREMIRKAEKKDISRIAEILVFDKRIKYRPIFKDDAYCFGKLQILAVSEQYGASDALESILVYDDGIVKGLIRIEKSEIVEVIELEDDEPDLLSADEYAKIVAD